jgi:hypothetical protein
MTEVILGLVGVIAISVVSHRGLRGWQGRRKAAWELERAGWREWITRP